MKINDLLNGFRWTLADFLRNLTRFRSIRSLGKKHRSFLDYTYTNIIDEVEFAPMLGPRKDQSMARCGWKWAVVDLRKELQALLKDQSFGQFQEPTENLEWGFLSGFGNAKQVMKIAAPHWQEIITAVACWDSEATKSKDTAGHQLVILSTCSPSAPEAVIKFSSYIFTIFVAWRREAKSGRLLVLAWLDDIL